MQLNTPREHTLQCSCTQTFKFRIRIIRIIVGRNSGVYRLDLFNAGEEGVECSALCPPNEHENRVSIVCPSPSECLSSLLVARRRTWVRARALWPVDGPYLLSLLPHDWSHHDWRCRTELTDVTYVLNVRETRCFRANNRRITFGLIPSVPSRWTSDLRTDPSPFSTANPLLIR